MIRPPDDASLADLFKRLGVPHEWLSGFFAALTMGPDSVANTAWMDPLLEPGEFEKDELPGAVAILLAMHDAIGGAVREAPARVVPEPSDVEGITAFCEGFVNGARLHSSWSKDDVGARRLFPFGLLAGAFADDDITSYEGEEVVDKSAFRDRHRADLEKHVIALRDHWQQRKVAGRTGRNDPCPCGSGKKYKKCCAA